jgi:beta-glucosidase
VAAAGAVLLKNENGLLPLDRSKLSTVAIIGDFATREQTHGGGSAELKALYEVTPLAGLVKRLGESANVTVSQGYKVVSAPRPATRSTQLAATRAATTRSATTPASGFDAAGMRTDAAPSDDVTMRPDEALIARAVEAAKAAEVAIVIAGTGHARRFDTEGSDRRDLRLPYGQDELIRRVVAANPRTVVVLLNGGPVDMPWLAEVPAVLDLWYGGMEAGNALADLLLGDANPSGKLPFTWPKRLADSPAHALDAYPGRDGVVEYKEGLYVGYRWFDERKVEPLFSFGHGLSYTTFECSNVNLKQGPDAGVPTLEVTCDVTNTGARAGAQVVQAYVHDVECSLPRPPQELKGYAKVMLAPGETRRVSLLLPPRSFAFWDPAAKAWTAEAGTFDVRLGFGSRDIRHAVRFELPQTVRVE